MVFGIQIIKFISKQPDMKLTFPDQYKVSIIFVVYSDITLTITVC